MGSKGIHVTLFYFQTVRGHQRDNNSKCTGLEEKFILLSCHITYAVTAHLSRAHTHTQRVSQKPDARSFKYCYNRYKPQKSKCFKHGSEQVVYFESAKHFLHLLTHLYTK